MKKLFLIAVAGMMMFAFTQCGGPFSEAKSIINDAISGVEKATKCEDLTKVKNDYKEAAEAYFKKYEDEMKEAAKEDKDFYTEDEEKELDELAEKFEKAYEAKKKELCKSRIDDDDDY